MLYKIKKIWCIIKYGKISDIVIDDINGIPSEIKYIDKNGNEIGYWAFGYFQPNMPYQGQSYFTFICNND